MKYNSVEYKELEDYIENKGAIADNYGSEDSPCIYFHHDKCSDLLQFDDKDGTIALYSAPEDLDSNSIGLDEHNGYFIVKNKSDVDKLFDALEKCKS
ncbi:MAG: hypothetical protein KAR20_03530 [Candidatus Heimdallarchaeota archaeon]|nr:hypothetical protein [Candidatus Heimdallarchaeota archaeon]